MRKNNIKGLDITYYTETLENGFNIILVPMLDKKNYFITYATKFGSDITKFTPNDSKEEIKVPDGIAHFLEHKMFEQEDGQDPFTFYSKSGTGSNASTSYDNTQYICYGTKNFNENLRYLLEFVGSPYYTDENVEKEKGIIAEELNMYNDIPDYQLEMKLRENVYQVSPRRVDIGGTVDTIKEITKENLYTCYNNFYSPNNMFILIVGNFNMKDAQTIIYEKLEFQENKGKPKVKLEKEPVEVRKKSETIKADIEVPKLAIGLKVPTKDFKYEPYELDLYLTMMSRILFGTTSAFREEMQEEKILTDMMTEWERLEDYRTFYLFASTKDPDRLLKEVKDALKEKKLDEESFQRLKKVWIANEVRISDNVEKMVDSCFDEILNYNEIVSNKIDIIRKLKYNDLEQIVDKIDMNNLSSMIMMPE